MSQFAAATRQVFAETFAGPGDTERQISERLVEQSEALLPLVAPTMDYVYRLHLREQLRHDALASEDLRDRQTPGAETVSVAFADLVGFTELGESVPPEELGGVTGSLEEVAREASHGPVRLVKMIGDAAMLASPDTEALTEATFELVEEMAVRGEEAENFPLLRAGIARGLVLSRRRRLLRVAGQPREPDHRRRPGRHRPGLRGREGAARGPLLTSPTRAASA